MATIGIDLDSTLIKMTVAGKAAKKLGYDYKDVDVIDWYQSNFPDDMKHLIISMFNDPVTMQRVSNQSKDPKTRSKSGSKPDTR